MKNFIKSLIVVALLLLSVYSFGQEQKPSPTYVENEFIIWLEQGVDASTFAVQSQAGITPKRLLSKRLNIWLFEIIDSKEPREDKMYRLETNADVRVIQNNHTNIVLRDAIPDDPYFYQQWAPQVMNLPQAWDEFTTGGLTATGDTIVVAVIDAGSCLDHEDLSFWKNTLEIPGNGIDDDNNGYIDDYDGWNAFSHTGNIADDSHAAHVAGIIGAKGNNGTGVCGVNWNVKIMPLRGSSGYEAMVVEAYSYVLEMRARYNETQGREGAFVVATNSSFGVDYGNPEDYPIWCSMYDEMGFQGILSCGAGPNMDVNVDEVGDVPSTCPGDYLIGVTNTTSADEKYGNAGYGINSIDIGSPGTSIYSTIPHDLYSNKTGTSMATPQVTGTIALMYSALPLEMMLAYKSDPGRFCLSVRQALLDGADMLPSLEGLVAYSRRLNAYGAIANILNQHITPTIDGTVAITGNPVFGQTLTANFECSSELAPYDIGALSYQWFCGTQAIEGAVSRTYTLSLDDIGGTICVQVAAEYCDGTLTSPSVGPVSKAEQMIPEAPQMLSCTSTSITLVALEGGEYAIDWGEWQPSPVFEGLTPNTSYSFLQRKRETITHNPSPQSPEAVFTTKSGATVDENASNLFKIFPNPSDGHLTVDGIGALTITNSLGQTVMTQEIDGPTTIELPQGLYFARMGNAVRKIVVE